MSKPTLADIRKVHARVQSIPARLEGIYLQEYEKILTEIALCMTENRKMLTQHLFLLSDAEHLLPTEQKIFQRLIQRLRVLRPINLKLEEYD